MACNGRTRLRANTADVGQIRTCALGRRADRSAASRIPSGVLLHRRVSGISPLYAPGGHVRQPATAMGRRNRTGTSDRSPAAPNQSGTEGRRSPRNRANRISLYDDQSHGHAGRVWSRDARYRPGEATSPHDRRLLLASRRKHGLRCACKTQRFSQSQKSSKAQRLRAPWRWRQNRQYSPDNSSEMKQWQAAGRGRRLFTASKWR